MSTLPSELCEQIRDIVCQQILYCLEARDESLLKEANEDVRALVTDDVRETAWAVADDELDEIARFIRGRIESRKK